MTELFSLPGRSTAERQGLISHDQLPKGEAVGKQGVFAALERSGHYAGLMVALAGTESRMRAQENSVALEFFGDRSTGFMCGDVCVSYVSCGLHVSVAHAPAGRWFLALGALGTVGVLGTDSTTAVPGAPQWSWAPGGHGLAEGLWGGSLDLGDGLDCSVRIQPAHQQKSPQAQVTAAFSVVPNRMEQRDAAWGYGARFLGALCSGDPAWTAKAATRRMVAESLARCAAYEEPVRDGARVPSEPSDSGSTGNLVTEPRG
ncbi:hypothetical protein N4G70_31975 [Streptomyces sp. ASQP_92]|uniref:hypothetical protein n=1 Tax=Streptomyces sp. ASQP_92 TaxID=2979116 RepID=UPI0021C087D5|nr:hypothetical protein [Streptomyces sp. ASQP_92]MCT9093453.1 hypothetical protein [Streptomyces sp. ASQP_92]